MRDITLIEQVQRRFTKRLRGYRNISYAERLRLLNLDTLEARRLKFDLIYCYTRKLCYRKDDRAMRAI